jgi:hypothetical protein
MTVSRTALAVVLSCFALGARAQDAAKPGDQPQKDAKPPAAMAAAPAEDAEEAGAWVGNRFLQTASPLVNDKGIFEAVFNHRFYASIVESGGSRLFGLDNGAAVFLSMDYAVLKNLSVQIGRATLNADYEFSAKATLLRPSASLPVAVGVRGGVNWLTANYFERQSSGFLQVLVQGSLANDHVVLAAAPSYTQRSQTRRQIINVPLIAAFKITHSIYAMGEYVPKYGREEWKAQWSFGLFKDIYHHRFGLWIGNSGATTVDQMLASDYGGGVTDSNIRIGFNLMRQFDLAAGKP